MALYQHSDGRCFASPCNVTVSCICSPSLHLITEFQKQKQNDCQLPWCYRVQHGGSNVLWEDCPAAQSEMHTVTQHAENAEFHHLWHRSGLEKWWNWPAGYEDWTRKCITLNDAHTLALEVSCLPIQRNHLTILNLRTVLLRVSTAALFLGLCI